MCTVAIDGDLDTCFYDEHQATGKSNIVLISCNRAQTIMVPNVKELNMWRLCHDSSNEILLSGPERPAKKNLPQLFP